MKDPAHLNSVKPVYHPFGMLLTGRSWEAGSGYRYGFNGKEHDVEVNGSGNVYDYGFRIYNPRLGKFLSVDPLHKNYAWYTPYQFAGNKVIVAVDLDGLEEYVVVRWYDNTGRYTGSTIFKIQNAADRFFGQAGILYLQLQATPANTTFVNNMSQASKNNNTNLDFTNQVTNPANGVVGNNRTLILGVGFIRGNTAATNQRQPTTVGNSTIPISRNASETNAFNQVETTLINDRANPDNGSQSAVALRFKRPAFIGFENNSSVYDPSLDNDNNGITNQQDLQATILYLNQNPEVMVTLTGNASTNGDATANSTLSQQRIQTISNLLVSNGITAGRITGVPQGSTLPISNAPQDNDPSLPSINRNVQISFDIPQTNQ